MGPFSATPNKANFKLTFNITAGPFKLDLGANITVESNSGLLGLDIMDGIGFGAPIEIDWALSHGMPGGDNFFDSPEWKYGNGYWSTGKPDWVRDLEGIRSNIYRMYLDW